MRNLLVTGGAGFIGSNFVHYMLEKYPDYRVVVYDKLTYAGRLENLDRDQGNPRFAFEQGDICDAARVREAIKAHDIDTVVMQPGVYELWVEDLKTRTTSNVARFQLTMNSKDLK